MKCASTPPASSKFMVEEVGLPASDALDVAMGPRMVKILLNLGADPGKFTFFNADYFARMSNLQVSDDSWSANSFRRSANLFPALGIRILAGATLPAPLEEWFDRVGQHYLKMFMITEGTVHMKSCYKTAQKLKKVVRASKRRAANAVRAARRARRRDRSRGGAR